MKQASLKKKKSIQSKFAVISSRFNPQVTKKLKQGCLKALLEAKVKKSMIVEVEVPGSFELPWAAQQFARKKDIDVVICLGAVIQGETDHHQYIGAEVARGISSLSLTMNKPIMFGVLTCKNISQALARSLGKNNKGYEVGWAAVEMANLAKQWKS
ncbi:6,7-dimethyl-8-ribityllumazine synthase [Patescibacteria group bacterium]|nr:6,7-dimethyl-8-ribityllumazine synthase [Patescibacteria group bacterium]MBU1890047.1 6,7-dimethyl-8-ribityllumazine synthase [Patescibacteria group bacterium]